MRIALGTLALALAVAACVAGLAALGLTLIFGGTEGPEAFADETWQVIVWWALAFAGAGLSAIAFGEALRVFHRKARLVVYAPAIIGAGGAYAGWYAFADYL